MVFNSDCPLFISGPKCDPSVTEMICYFYPIKAEDRCFPADLVVIELTNFDVILRMDWLSQIKGP